MTDTPHPPIAAPVPAAAQPPRDVITAGMIESLKKTKPLVRFLAVLGFIVSGIMILVSLGMLGFGLYQGARGNTGSFVLVGMAVLYLAVAILYIFPSRYLYRYADSIRDAIAARSKTAAVERALQQQKSFWKFVGIFTLVTVLLYIPGIFAAIAIPNLLTAMQRSKQKRSMADIRTIGTAVEGYATDHNAYPNVKSMAELAPLLQPKYVKVAPRLDGWGNAIVYEPVDCTDSGCRSYFIASGGKDGKLESAPSAHGADFAETKNFNEDIVFSNGKFVSAPESMAPR